MSAAAQGEAHSVGHRRLTVTGGARLGTPVDTHGLNRRPSRADLTPIDPAAHRGVHGGCRACGPGEPSLVMACAAVLFVGALLAISHLLASGVRL